MFFFFFSSRRRHTRFKCDWSSDVCSSDLLLLLRIAQTSNGKRGSRLCQTSSKVGTVLISLRRSPILSVWHKKSFSIVPPFIRSLSLNLGYLRGTWLCYDLRA